MRNTSVMNKNFSKEMFVQFVTLIEITTSFQSRMKIMKLEYEFKSKPKVVWRNSKVCLTFSLFKNSFSLWESILKFFNVKWMNKNKKFLEIFLIKMFLNKVKKLKIVMNKQKILFFRTKIVKIYVLNYITWFYGMIWFKHT